MQKKSDKEMFVKMYFKARKSGLLAAISDKNWKTLCVLATYMDKYGCCYPSQETIAKNLSISRTSAGNRLRDLTRFRFHGQPLVQVEMKKRTPRGRFGSNFYKVLPVSGLKIFFSSSHKK